MSVESIVEKIRSDGHAEAENILAAGRKKADDIVNEANREAEKHRRETEEDVERRVQAIAEHYAAAARLDVKKIRLAARKKAAESVYAEAKKRLRNLSEEDTLKLFGRLLSSYAEEGDSVVFADDFGYVDQVALLPVFLQRKLSVLKAEKAQGVHVDGGLYLVGKTADKDLTFDALLKADFEERQAEIVNALFGNG